MGEETYLFAWNPKRWSWAEFEKRISDVALFGYAEISWSSGNRTQLPVGSRCFLIRLGEEPKGVIGSGRTIGNPTPLAHWNPEKAKQGQTVNSVRIRLDHLARSPVIPWSELNRPQFSGFNWGIQASGVHIPSSVAIELESTWQGRTSADAGGRSRQRPQDTVSAKSFSDGKFQVGNKYTKNDIYRICAVPGSQQKGNWNTGYTSYHGDWFIFCNVGVAGRTGHNYANRFVGDDLVWYGKTGSHLGQGSIQSLLAPIGNVLIFYRLDDRDAYTFAGKAKAKEVNNTSPIEIVWDFSLSAADRPETLAEEVSSVETYREGSTKQIAVNIYERNPLARNAAIEHFGAQCFVCGFDFELAYGALGRGFIHVHHLKELADIGEEYEINPITDMRPVCPNCHAMLHRRRPAYSIEELQALIRRR